jgi:hypothetical protein
MFHKNTSHNNLRRQSWMGLIAVIILLALPAIVAAAPTGLAQAGTALRLIASPQQIDVNETTTVTLQVENVTDLAGVEFTLSFDPALLERRTPTPAAMECR